MFQNISFKYVYEKIWRVYKLGFYSSQIESNLVEFSRKSLREKTKNVPDGRLKGWYKKSGKIFESYVYTNISRTIG